MEIRKVARVRANRLLCVLSVDGLLNGPLAPLGLLLAAAILAIPLVFMYAFLGVLRILGKRHRVSSGELIAWWIGGVLVLGWLRDADSWFW
jgi:hypothetical protein